MSLEPEQVAVAHMDGASLRAEAAAEDGWRHRGRRTPTAIIRSSVSKPGQSAGFTEIRCWLQERPTYPADVAELGPEHRPEHDPHESPKPTPARRGRFVRRTVVEWEAHAGS